MSIDFVDDPSGSVVLQHPLVPAKQDSSCKGMQDAVRDAIWFASPYVVPSLSKPVLLDALFVYPVVLERRELPDAHDADLNQKLSSELKKVIHDLKAGKASDAEEYFSRTTERSIKFVLTKTLWMRVKRTRWMSRETADLEELLNAMPAKWVGKNLIDAHTKDQINELEAALKNRDASSEITANKALGEIMDRFVNCVHTVD